MYLCFNLKKKVHDPCPYVIRAILKGRNLLFPLSVAPINDRESTSSQCYLSLQKKRRSHETISFWNPDPFAKIVTSQLFAQSDRDFLCSQCTDEYFTHAQSSQCLLDHVW